MNDIEVKDWKLGESSGQVSQVNKARKIRFRKSSFTVIYNTFKDFIRRNAINIVDKKLNDAKKDLVNMEVNRGDKIENYDGETNKEKKIENKVNAIIRLSNIINFLERKNYNKAIKDTSIEDNRPLRLKKLMEKNLRENMNGLEVIPEAEKENTMKEINDIVNNTQKSIEEETKILNDKIGDIKVEEDKNIENENFNNITVEDVKEAVDSIFESEKNNDAVVEKDENKGDSVTFEDVKNVVDQKFENSSSEEKVENTPKVLTPIENIQKINIGEIVLPKTSEEKNINDDIFNTEESTKVEVNVEEKENKRELPVVVPEREEKTPLEKVKEDMAESKEAYNELLNNTAINDEEKRDELTKKIVELDDKIAKETSQLSEEDIKNLKEENVEETTEEEKKESQKENVEETTEEDKEIPQEENIGFDFSDASLSDIKKAAENTTSKKDLASMMDKINKIKMLQKEAEKTSLQRNKAIEENEAKEKEFKETCERLDRYSDELEKKCNQNLEETNAIKNKVREKDEAINSMLKIMEASSEKGTSKKK